jgi:plasmid maintenance system killer protein
LSLYTRNVIRSFRDPEAQKLFDDEFSKKYRAMERTARRKLTMLDEAETIQDLAVLPGTHLEALARTARGSTAFASTTSSAFASTGRTGTPRTWKSWITIRGIERTACLRDWNPSIPERSSGKRS